MWKKIEQAFTDASTVTIPAQPAAAMIGPSITIQGELSGEEDLVIEGTVNGTVSLNQHQVTIGKKGRIQANIYAKMIKVEGEVKGDLKAEHQVIICKSAHVIGNVVAPKVALMEGCRFKGSIDMESPVESLSSPKRSDKTVKQDSKEKEDAAV